jgi:CheY-like chemotaxis protein
LVLLPAGGRETVLVAEDEAGIRAMTRAYLEGLGYRVLEAADGMEAVRVSSEYSGVIDLVLTDVLMPGIRGDTAVEEIRKSRPAAKAIFMSGYTDQDLASNGETTLQKPFDFPELGRRLREVLDTPRQ